MSHDTPLEIVIYICVYYTLEYILDHYEWQYYSNFCVLCMMFNITTKSSINLYLMFRVSEANSNDEAAYMLLLFTISLTVSPCGMQCPSTCSYYSPFRSLYHHVVCNVPVHAHIIHHFAHCITMWYAMSQAYGDRNQPETLPC